MRSYASCSPSTRSRRVKGGAIAVLVATLGLPLPATALTLDFETLGAAPGVDGFATLSDANGGTTISGVMFDSAANAEWDVVGNGYTAPYSSDPFAAAHSGNYALTGNAWAGSVTDYFGNTYQFDGLTISTTQRLTKLYAGYDDNGGGANDADSLTITALTASGEVSKSFALTSFALTLLDTSSVFAGLSGVTGYRFTTTASNGLYEAAGQAYLVADDLTFATAAVPEPAAAALMSLGLGLALVATRGGRRRPLAGQGSHAHGARDAARRPAPCPPPAA